MVSCSGSAHKVLNTQNHCSLEVIVYLKKYKKDNLKIQHEVGGGGSPENQWETFNFSYWGFMDPVLGQYLLGRRKHISPYCSVYDVPGWLSSNSRAPCSWNTIACSMPHFFSSSSWQEVYLFQPPFKSWAISSLHSIPFPELLLHSAAYQAAAQRPKNWKCSWSTITNERAVFFVWCFLDIRLSAGVCEGYKSV